MVLNVFSSGSDTNSASYVESTSSTSSHYLVSVDVLQPIFISMAMQRQQLAIGRWTSDHRGRNDLA